MLAKFRIPQPAPHQLGQRIVLALPGTADIVGAGRRELGEPCVQHRPQLWVGHQFCGAHAVGSLTTTPQEAAPTRPVLLGECPIRVQMQRQPLGHLLELIGPQVLRMFGQRPLCLLHLDSADMFGQLVKEPLDDPHMLTVEMTGMPGLRGGRQQGCELLTGQCGAWRQLLGIANPPPRCGTTDPQHIGQYVRNRRAPLVSFEVSELGVRDGDLATHRVFETFDGREPLRRRQFFDVGSAQHLDRCVERVECHFHRTHVRILRLHTDKNRRQRVVLPTSWSVCDNVLWKPPSNDELRLRS